MNIKNPLKAKKYRTRIFLWITSVMIILIIMFSTVIYLKVENTVLSSEYESSQKILNQMKYNIDFLDQMVKNLCLSTYYNNDIKTLMSYNDEETYEQMNIINKLSNSVVASNPYIQSIYVYNNRKKVFYSTYNSFKYEDPDLIKLMQSDGNIPVLKPIFRQTETYHSGDVIRYSNVLTYFMYELKDSQNNMQGAVIINIKLDWLIENINIINMFNNSRQDKVFILDENGELIRDGVNSNTESTEFEEYIKELYQSKSIDAQKYNKTELLKDKIGNKNYFISSIPIQQANWVMYKVQPYDIVFDYINNLKYTIIIITCVVLILIFIASYSISRGIYKPFEGLLKLVGFNSQSNVGAKENGDEFSYLSQVYKNSIDKLEKYSTERKDNEKIIKMYFLRKILFQSASITQEEFEINKLEHGVSLDQTKPFIIILLLIDRHKDFEEKNDVKMRDVLKFAIVNITSEILSSFYKCETVEMKNDQIAIILNREYDSSEVYEHLTPMIREAQEIVRRHYSISFSAILSEETSKVSNLTLLYNQAVDYSAYRFVYGLMSIITPEMMNKNLWATDNDSKYEKQNKLIEEIRQGNLKSAETSFRNLVVEIKKLEYNNMMLFIAHLVNSIKNTVFDLNQTKRDPINISSILDKYEIFELETIDEFERIILLVLQQVVTTEGSKSGSKDLQLVENIQSIILTSYSDCNLSISNISSTLRISTAKISNAFKENLGMSIVEYINDVRLEKAVEWLENSRLSIGEIMHKVGIENESYFYKIFKAKYGTTPRSYITRNIYK